MICSSNKFFLTIQIQKCRDIEKFAFLLCLDDKHFKCLFHKQSESGFESESGSEIKAKLGSGSEKNHFGSTTLVKGDHCHVGKTTRPRIQWHSPALRAPLHLLDLCVVTFRWIPLVLNLVFKYLEDPNHPAK
jgi:hypothetical protein